MIVVLSACQTSSVVYEPFAASPGAYPLGPEDNYFNWPPNQGVMLLDITSKFATELTGTYQDVDNAITASLFAAGYESPHYYNLRSIRTGAPLDGFVMVTRPEQIRRDGSLLSPRGWQISQFTPRELNFLQLIAALAHAPRGHYRTILFAVTSDTSSLHINQERATESEVLYWAYAGAPSLGTRSIQPVKAGTRVYVLVYQFEKTTAQNIAMLTTRPTGIQNHLREAGLGGLIGSQR